MTRVTWLPAALAAVLAAAPARAANLTWTGALGSAWDVGTTPNWNAGAVFADEDTVTFDDTAVLATVVVAPGGVAPAGTVVSASVLSYSLGGDAITGGGGLTKTGTAALRLSGPNTYTGPTLIQGGAVQAANEGVLPDVSPVTVAAGASLDLDGHVEMIGPLTGPAGGVVGLGADGRLDLNTTVDATYAGDIAGTGGVVKYGAGTQYLDGAVTAPVTVDSGLLAGDAQLAGALVVAPAGAVSPGHGAGHLQVGGGGTLLFGTMLAELGGTQQGTDYDWLDVLGPAFWLPGAVIDVDFIDGWVPAGEGMSYTILTSGIPFPSPLSDLAFNFNGAPLPVGQWQARIEPWGPAGQALVLVTMPEPATTALLGLAVFGLGGYVRERRRLN